MNNPSPCCLGSMRLIAQIPDGKTYMDREGRQIYKQTTIDLYQCDTCKTVIVGE